MADFINDGVASYIIYYFSNEPDTGFENSIEQQAAEMRISNISIPRNFTGQQLQIQVTLNFFRTQESPRSSPLTVGKTSYIMCSLYLQP